MTIKRPVLSQEQKLALLEEVGLRVALTWCDEGSFFDLHDANEALLTALWDTGVITNENREDIQAKRRRYSKERGERARREAVGEPFPGISYAAARELLAACETATDALNRIADLLNEQGVDAGFLKVIALPLRNASAKARGTAVQG